MKAEIWTIEQCPYCIKAKQLLDLFRVEYKERQGFHPDWKTVPYITIDGNPVGGFVELTSFLRNL